MTPNQTKQKCLANIFQTLTLVVCLLVVGCCLWLSLLSSLLLHLHVRPGRVSGKNAMGIMKSSGQGLRTASLRQVWALADNDKDGHLTSEEFAVAMYLIEQANEGIPLPQTLPKDLIPPSQR